MGTVNTHYGLAGNLEVLYLYGVDVPILFLICYYTQQIADEKLNVREFKIRSEKVTTLS